MRAYRSVSGWPALTARASRSNAGLLLALAILVFSFTFLLTGLSAFLTLSATSQAVTALDRVGPSQRQAVVQARLSDDASTQRSVAEQILARVLDRSAVRVEVEEREEGGQQYVRWTITPHPTDFTAAAIPGLIEGIDGLQRTFGADDRVGAGGVTTEGSLTTTLADVQRRLGAEQGASLVPLTLIGVIGVVALGQAARLVASARGPQLGLIRSRGASLRRLGLTASLEAALVALPAAFLGGGGAILTLAIVYPSIGVDRVLWAISAVIVVATALIVGFSTVGTSRTASLSAPAFSGRGRTAVGAVSLVLIVVLAALSYLQFLVYGSPLVITESGRPRVEPFIAAAPALLLLAIVIVGLVLFAPTARLAEVAVARSRGVRPSFAVRQVARRVGLHAVSVTVVALAVGAIVLASTYSATLASASVVPPLLRAGSDVVVGSAGAALPPLDEIATADGVTAASPAIAVSAKVGGDSVEVVALPADRLDAVMTDLRGEVDVPAIATALTAPPVGLPFSEPGVVTVAASVTIGQPSDGEVYFEGVPVEVTDTTRTVVRLVAVDPAGTVTVVPLEAIVAPIRPAPGERDATTRVTRTAELPATEGLRLIGIEVSIEGGFTSRDHTVTIESVSGIESLDGEWGFAGFSPESDFSGIAFPELGEGASAVIPGFSVTQRVMLITPGAATGPTRAYVSDALATRLALEPGDTITVSSGVFGDEFEFEVVGTVPVVPGTSGSFGVLADLPSVEVALLGADREPGSDGGYPGGGANELWLASDDPAATARALPDSLDVEVPRTAALEPTTTAVALWLGALGALLLAAATLLAGNGMVSRARTGELRVLRALGMSRPQISAARRLEVVVVVAFGVLLGAVAGIASAALTVSALARSATIGMPASLDVPLLVDPVPLVVLLGATVLVFTAVSVIAGRQATARARLETREVTA